MDQYTNKRQSQFLYNLIANPANPGQEYMNDLQQLVKNFPQSGILQALLAHANGSLTLQQAAAYFDPALLYKVLKHPEGLPVVEPGQVFYQSAAAGFIRPAPANTQSEIITPVQLPYINDLVSQQTGDSSPAATVELEGEVVAGIENVEPQLADYNRDQEIADVPAIAADNHEQDIQDDEPKEVVTSQSVADYGTQPTPEITEDLSAPANDVDTSLTEVEHSDAALSEQTTDVAVDNSVTIEIGADRPDEEPAQPESVSPVSEENADDAEADYIEDEVYDEIVSIDDINIETVKQPTDDEVVFTFSEPFSEQEADHLVAGTEDTHADHNFKLEDEADKLIVGNIAATDYFMFDRAFGKVEVEDAVTGAEPVQDVVTPAPEASTQTASDAVSADEESNVSRYHDEKMPYSFLWWLDKTRKEHAGVYRPYAAVQPQASAGQVAVTDALQQQYYENIFHITSVDQLDKSTAGNGDSKVKHKGDEIIERFIKEEPQIRPTNTERLDNENKAKKSSEDQNDLVTETLANIYAEQMLYPKAIAIYKKLMLKFPEKSRYFADRIKNLEKK
ncbi:hypothetical protein DJ568_15965 [Mucilaginibacter hurinus]|uniref:Tetratricopeptide repeat protein n=1 Tax=Mucilaginibacter hurinus TaxID=2201324 RepID=A0A367GJT5_9SPHI|nr:hypothetical protein [Mucilaginibacter hurinus]RCH53734.1 hypothetical protein DJ568_15965 [Mucilaginibacter hurinus]